MDKKLIAIGVSAILFGLVSSVAVYQTYDTGTNFFASAFEKSVITKSLEAPSAKRPHILVAFDKRPTQAYSASDIKVRAQTIRALGVGLQAYDFEFERQEVLPLLGYAVGKAPASKIDEIRQDPGVRAVAQNTWIQVESESNPLSEINSPSPLNQITTDYMTPSEMRDFHNADKLPKAQENTIVTVVDSGAPKNVDWIENAISVTDADPKADYFHGSAVCRVVHGIAPNVGINSVKALGPTGTARLSTILRGLEKAVLMKPRTDILSLSIGTPSGVFNPMNEAVNAISREYGVEIVTAAGNTKGGGETAPATSSSTLSVGALNGTGEEVAFYSASEYDVLAVGDVQVEVFGETKRTSGTSFACPAVSGLLARGLTVWKTPTSKLDAKGTFTESIFAEAELPIVDGESLSNTEPVKEQGLGIMIWPYALLATVGVIFVLYGLKREEGMP